MPGGSRLRSEQHDGKRGHDRHGRRRKPAHKIPLNAAIAELQANPPRSSPPGPNGPLRVQPSGVAIRLPMNTGLYSASANK